MDHEETEHMTDPDNVPQANQILFSLKLVSGEELMCTVIDAKENGSLVIESPISIKTIPILMEDGSFSNRLNTQLWMPYSASRIFHLDRIDIIATSQLHPHLHKFYAKMVNKYEYSGEIEAEDLMSVASMMEEVKTIQ